jgi:mono/diheme cytochrome c family protein
MKAAVPSGMITTIGLKEDLSLASAVAQLICHTRTQTTAASAVRRTDAPTGILSAGVVLFFLAALLTVFPGCSHQSTTSYALPKPTSYGTAVVEASGGKQTSQVGTPLEEPVVVQVNDEQGNAVAGALVVLHGPNGVYLDPSAGLTDAGGQFNSTVSLGAIPGHYRLTATTGTKTGTAVNLKIDAIALGYQEVLGSQLSNQYCARCHNQESTPERVSNYDNLEVKPHPFTEGDALNKVSDADLVAIISHGGPALSKSALMPPYGYTLSKSEIQALVAYIRIVSDPPYGAPGVVYAQK